MLKETEKKERLRLKRKRTIMSLVLMLALVFSGITPVNVRAKSETLENGEVSHEVRKYYDDDDDYMIVIIIRKIHLHIHQYILLLI